MTLPKNFIGRREQRRVGAIHRADARAARPDAEQLAYLEHRGHGHCAEAMRLRVSMMDDRDEALKMMTSIPKSKKTKETRSTS